MWKGRRRPLSDSLFEITCMISPPAAEGLWGNALHALLFIASTFAATAAGIAAGVSKRLHERLSDDYFKYSSMFHLCATIWSIGFVVQALFNSPERGQEAFFAQLLFTPFLYLATAFLVACTESLRGKEHSIHYDLAFLLAGILLAGLFVPGFLSLEYRWGIWMPLFHSIYQLAHTAMIVLCIIVLVPLAMRVRKRLALSVQRDRNLLATLVIIIVFLPPVFLLYGLPQIAMLALFQQPSFATSVTGFFFLWIALLQIQHPTVLFSASNDLIGFYIIEKESGLPLYYYSFVEKRKSGEILSAFLTSIRHFISQELARGEIENITLGTNQVIVEEGLLSFGIVLARQSSPLIRSLPKIALNDFEAKIAFRLDDASIVGQFNQFDEFVEKYSEFALQ
jgi:hypothetical protein